MKLRRWISACVVLTALAGVAFVAQRQQSAGAKMADAAERFLAALTPDQKAKTSFAFDHKERLNWHFIPLQDTQKRSTRKGLPLEAMNAEQRKLAQDLLKSGTSPDGYQQVTTIISLEAILRELERSGAMVRNPDWYFFTIFGTPSKTGKWGWRVEGHHLSLNFTLDGGNVIASTPTFFGANPATVKSGPRKGLRTLADVDDLAMELFKGLEDSQQRVAYQQKQLPEVTAQNVTPQVAAPIGLPAAQMNEKQRGLLLKLLTAYTSRMPPDVAEHEMRQVHEAGIDKVHFAYAGGTQPGKPHTYRIQGPTFLAEFLNIQQDSAGNPANHIHSCWRCVKGDFGLRQD